MSRPPRTQGLLLLVAAAGIAGAVWLALASTGATAGSKESRALVRRTPLVERLIDSGQLRVLERYDVARRQQDGTLDPAAPPTLLVVGDAHAIERLSGSSEAPLRRRVADRILLQSRAIDTSRKAPSQRSSGAGGRLEVVQFHGPIRPEWLASLRKRGVRLLGYVPHNAYIVWVEAPSDLEGPGLPLRWHEPLAPEDRVGLSMTSSPDPIEVTIQVARAGDFRQVLDETLARALFVRMPARQSGETIMLRATLPPEALADLAARPEVLWVEPFAPPVTHDEKSALIAAGQISGNRPLGPGYLSWLAARGLGDLGSTIVDVTDSGIDRGDTVDVHPGLRGRILYSTDLTGEGSREDCAGHGTNIAGIIAGASGPGNELVDSDGYQPGLGVAPSVRLGATRIFTCDDDFRPGGSFTDIVASAYANGARIGNNSWGGIGPQYNTISAEYDALVRDANRDPSDGDQSFLPVFSVGNLGPGLGSVGWPATAKNVLSVGASEGFRTGVTDGCGVASILADNVNHVLSFSSRGPTSDGRIKPDLVAPGSHIQSLASRAVGYTASGVCDAHFPPGQQVLNWSSGTSQAAAHATGAAALAAHLYRAQRGVDPSPAMLKAILISHAHDMGTSTGTPSNTSNRPNELQGWGRVDVGSVASTRTRVAVDQTHVFRSTGESMTFRPIVPVDPNRPVVVTLVWTDAPGTPPGWAWVNDLDLVVKTGGATYLGNVFERGVSVTGGQADFRNNVENVVLPPGQTSLEVTVEASNIAGDGLPSLPGETDQDFALYIANAYLPEDFGLVTFGREAADCGKMLPVTVADRGLAGAGLAMVSLEAGADRETVRMSETPPGSGVFTGVIDVDGGAVVAGDGRLQTADGVPVRAIYVEPDPTTGRLLEREATIGSRCVASAISNAAVTRVGAGQATVRWKTDRPSDSRVLYGAGSNRGQTAFDPKSVTDHAVRLSGLATCTFHTATVASTDGAGLRAEGPATPLRFTTGPGVGGRRTLFRDDAESLATRWQHRALGAGVDDWELGFPSSGPPGPFSGSRVWATGLGANYSVGADGVLESLPIDLRDAIAPQLTFFHFYSISGGFTPFSVNDGGWVEASGDGGATWFPLEPVGGYPDEIDPDNPYLPDGSRVYAGSLTAWTKATFDLSVYTGSVLRIRFHLWQDASETTPTSSGWFIDDIAVTAEANCKEGRITLDSEEYGCSSAVNVTLNDTDLNRAAAAVETAQVTASTPSGTLQVELTETGPNSGEFHGRFDLTPGASPGRLPARAGDQVVVRYDDQDAGGGASAVVTASALVPECTPPPPPAQVTIEPNGLRSVRVRWTPVDTADAPDLQGYRVHYDTDGPGPAYSGTGAVQGASPVRIEAAISTLPLSQLTACAPHFVTVTAFDRLGNESLFAPEAFTVPDGSTPCLLGRVALLPIQPGCAEPLRIELSDANADPDPMVAGRVTLFAASTSQPAGLPVEVVETAASSGVFVADLPLSSVPQPGSLTVSQADTVTVTYTDTNDGSGVQRTVSSRVTIGDCSPPVISDVRVTGLGSDRAVIRWRTDEPASSNVSFGPDASMGQTASTSGLKTDHAVPLTSLPACSPVFYTVTSTDARANTATADDAGAPFRFGTAREVPAFTDDFESGAPGWTHATLGTAIDEWEHGAPQGDSSGQNRAPSSALSGVSVWATDLDGPYERRADMVLVSPPIDLTRGETATLTFQHWYDITSVGAPLGFDDGGFLEVSTDGGQSWTYVAPGVAPGYPDVVGPNKYTPFAAGAYAGSTHAWVPARFLLDAYLGQVIRLRFHLWQDEQDPVVTPGLGWYLDDVSVTTSFACRAARLRLDRDDYGCGGGEAGVLLTDIDLDLDPLVAEQTMILLVSDSEPSGEIITLTETGPSTGEFEGSIPLSSTDAPGVLRVQDADTIRALYDDLDDGTGASSVVSDTATVSDCQPPVISGVTVRDLGPGGFRVEWTTSEPSERSVVYGTTPAFGSVATSGAAPSLFHSVTVTGLDSCTRYFFTIEATDALGNVTRESDTAGAREVKTPNRTTLLVEDFESGAPGWTHAGMGDTWRIGVTGPLAPPSGSSVAGTTLTAAYTRPTGTVNSDFTLVSPLFSLTGASSPELSFRHTYDFPASFQGGDGGWVEGWNGFGWVRLTPIGGYPGFIDPESGRAGERLPGYNGRSDAAFTLQRFDLTGLLKAGATVTRIRFHAFVEAGVGATGAGWRIDDVIVTSSLPCQQGRLLFERDRLTCSAASMDLSLLDTDLDLDPAVRETVVVTVASSGTSSSLPVTLREVAAAGGYFRGPVPLDPAGTPPALRSAPGDVITASYLDEDDGSGGSILLVVPVTVAPCPGPSIRGVSARSFGPDLLVRWSTDVPATSEAVLSSAGGTPLLASDSRLRTSHELTIPGAVPCTSYSLSIASEDGDGTRTTLDGGPAGSILVETVNRTILFKDDFEGPDPGWIASGFEVEWERGIPVKGPSTAFSGQKVLGTDLDGDYDGGTNATLRSPPIDLRGVSEAKLRFWHWYDLFASDPPNSFDDSAWVEVEILATGEKRYIEPIGGYSDVTDSESGEPLPEGTPVYAGQSEDWELAVFDLSPFTGQVIAVRLRIWNDLIELLVNLITGTGWYIDDLEVTSQKFCFATPTITSGGLGTVSQGAIVTGLQIGGSGFRPGATLSAGPGVSVTALTVLSPSSIRFDVTIDSRAPLGARKLTLTNPDGQSATLQGALRIAFSASAADMDGSGRIDAGDLIALAAAFGAIEGAQHYRPQADLNGDGIVDGFDLALLASVFGSRF